MKKKQKSRKLSLDKFTISELKKPSMIIGGTGLGDDDGTDESDDGKKKCILNSSAYVEGN